MGSCPRGHVLHVPLLWSALSLQHSLRCRPAEDTGTCWEHSAWCPPGVCPFTLPTLCSPTFLCAAPPVGLLLPLVHWRMDAWRHSTCAVTTEASPPAPCPGRHAPRVAPAFQLHFFFSADNCRKRGSSAVITCLISPRPFACCECAVPKQPSAAAQLVPNHSGPKPQPGLVLGAQPGAIPCPQFPYVQSKCQVRGCSSQLALSVPCTVLDRQTLKDFAMWLSWDGPVLGTGGRMAILDAAKGRARLSALNCPPGE